MLSFALFVFYWSFLCWIRVLRSYSIVFYFYLELLGNMFLEVGLGHVGTARMQDIKDLQQLGHVIELIEPSAFCSEVGW